MDTEAKQRMIKLAESDLAAARDNLYRANLAARAHDPSKLWGASGQTLQSIIDGYAAWESKALATLAEIQAS